MKTLPPGLDAHVRAAATTLATCWRITRRDGAVLGFTDHDRDLEIEGTVCRADSGPESTAESAGPGLAVGGAELAGAFAFAGLASADLDAGLWDRARIEVWRVNWQAPEQRVLMRRGEIGEVTRTGEAFRAELRGLSQQLEETRGRIFGHLCDADLGDARCGVDLGGPGLAGAGEVLEVATARRFSATGLDGFPKGWFARGLLRWTQGANAGAEVEIAAHESADGVATLEMWLDPPQPVSAGDRFTVTAGCDKRAETCAARFSNIENFRGFPHMPGNDFVLSYPSRDSAGNDGGALVE